MPDKAEALKERNLQFLADFFKVLGDPTRMKILLLLFEGEICVGDLASRLAITDSAVSHQLQVLKTSKLVKRRRNGKLIIYTLADDHVRSIVAQGWEHISESLRNAATEIVTHELISL